MPDTQLQVLINESGLESTKAQVMLREFTDYFNIAAEWEERAKAIVVTSEDQIVDMKIAREGRLFLRDKRLAIERTRKSLKEQALREGRAIDGIANILKALIIPIEKHLDDQEHFVQIREKARAEAARIEAEQQAERDRLAAVEAERLEQERIRVENERLRRESAEKQEALRQEQEARDADKLIADMVARKAERVRLRLEQDAENLKLKAEEEKRKTEDREREAREAHAREVEGIERERLEERVRQEAKIAEIVQNTSAGVEIICPRCGHKFTSEVSK